MNGKKKNLIIGILIVVATLLIALQLLNSDSIVQWMQQSELGLSILDAIGISNPNSIIYSVSNDSLFDSIWFASLGPFLLIVALEVKLLTAEETY